MQAELKKILNGFGESPLLRGKLMRELLESDREGFRSAAIPLLKSISDERGGRYLITLLWTNDLLIQALCDNSALPLEQAITVSRAAARVDPQFHIRLLRHLIDGLEERTEPSVDPGAGRLLEIVGAITDRGSVLPLLTQLLRHPDARIRSKAALLIGRANKSAKWLEKRMSEEDPRVRANAIEALWGVDGGESRAILWEAVKDGHNRVAGNALVGLYRAGDVTAVPVFLEMAGRAEPVFRSTAAWSMGETEDPRFLQALGRMLADAQGSLRKTVFHAINRIKNGQWNTAGRPQLRVDVIHARQTQEGTKLRVTVTDSEARPLTKLPPTHFIVWEEGAPIARYCVEEHSMPDALVVGFALPRRVEATDSYRGICEVSMLAGLENKRKTDLWCVLKYADAEQTGTANTSERLFGQDISVAGPVVQTAGPEVGFSANPPVLQHAIESAGDRFSAVHGMLPACQRLLDAIASVRGARHLILLQDRGSPADASAVRAMVFSAQAARVAIHAISLYADPALRELCADTGGAFRQLEDNAAVPGAFESLYASLLFCYELQYRSEAAPSPESSTPLRVQVLAPEGQGEASFLTG